MSVLDDHFPDPKWSEQSWSQRSHQPAEEVLKVDFWIQKKNRCLENIGNYQNLVNLLNKKSLSPKGF